MIAESIATLLQTQGILIKGTNLFIGELPFDKNEIVSMVYSPSPDPNKAIDVYDQVIDFWGRFAKTNTGYAKMKQIMDFLHKKQNYSISGYHVYFSNAVGMIDDNDRDVERRKLFKLSVRFIFRPA